MRIRLTHILTAIFILAAGCSKVDPEFVHPGKGGSGSSHERTEDVPTRHVLVLYFAGYNSLSPYMNREPSGDYQDLLKGYLPPRRDTPYDDVLLLYSQYPEKYGDYTGAMKSHLVRLSTDFSGNIVKDTLRTYGEEYKSADSQTLRTVLTDVRDMFPAKDYGFVFSSHATGWLPAGYTITSYPTESKVPRMNSIGQTLTGKSGSYRGYEMDLRNFAAAFPMKFDYIMLDACLCGGIEVAYQLKDVCNKVAFSPTEVMAEGYDYKSITSRLLGRNGHDVTGVCEDFFAQYTVSSQPSPYCTSSAVDCTKLDALASVCGRIFESNRDGMERIDPDTVQGYFQYNWHWFYDLEDIVVKSGASAAELKELREALDACVICNLATERFLTIKILTHCGLSMYLPCNGSSTLDGYYKELAWNKATGLVK